MHSPLHRVSRSLWVHWGSKSSNRFEGNFAQKKSGQLILSNNFHPKSGVKLSNRRPGCACIPLSIVHLQVCGSIRVPNHPTGSKETLRKKIWTIDFVQQFSPKVRGQIE